MLAQPRGRIFNACGADTARADEIKHGDEVRERALHPPANLQCGKIRHRQCRRLRAADGLKNVGSAAHGFLDC
jgi:hypothetical protein